MKKMAILRLKDQEHLLEPTASGSATAALFSTPPPPSSFMVKEELVIHADPVYSDDDDHNPRQQSQPRRDSELNETNSPAQLSPCDFSATGGRQVNWPQHHHHHHQQQQQQRYQQMLMVEKSGGGGGWTGGQASNVTLSLKKKRKPVNLCIQCPVCGGPAPDHMHFGGQSCYSCRAFFRRTSQRPISSFRCRGGKGDCVVSSGSKSCIPCRLRKCLKIGMDPTLVKGKKGAVSLATGGGGGDYRLQSPLHLTSPVYADQYSGDKSDIPAPSSFGTVLTPPIPPLTPLNGAADSATWLRFKADLLKYKGLQMQYQANLLERQARLLLVEEEQRSDVRAVGQCDVIASHAPDEKDPALGYNSRFYLTEDGDDQSPKRRHNNSSGAVDNNSMIGNHSSVLQHARGQPNFATSAVAQPRFYLEQQQQQPPRSILQYGGCGGSFETPVIEHARSSVSSGSAASITPPSLGGGRDEELENVEEEEEEEEDGPMDLSSTHQQPRQRVQLPNFEQLQQQSSHMRYSTMPRIFFRHQQEVGAGGAYSC